MVDKLPNFFQRLLSIRVCVVPWRPSPESVLCIPIRTSQNLEKNKSLVFQAITEFQSSFPFYQTDFLRSKFRAFSITIELDNLGRDASPDHGAEAAIADWKRVSPVFGGFLKRHFQRPGTSIVHVLLFGILHQNPSFVSHKSEGNSSLKMESK